MSAFDLDQFAPPPIRFRLQGREYQVSGDPDVDIVARMLRIEDALGESPETDEIVALVREGRDLILEMVQEYEPDVAELKLGSRELLIVFSLISHGPSVAAAVAEAISQHGDTADGAGEPVATPQTVPGEREPEESADPLASGSLSSGTFSGSDGEKAGLLATGSA